MQQLLLRYLRLVLFECRRCNMSVAVVVVVVAATTVFVIVATALFSWFKGGMGSFIGTCLSYSCFYSVCIVFKDAGPFLSRAGLLPHVCSNLL